MCSQAVQTFCSQTAYSAPDGDNIFAKGGKGVDRMVWAAARKKDAMLSLFGRALHLFYYNKLAREAWQRLLKCCFSGI